MNDKRDYGFIEGMFRTIYTGGFNFVILDCILDAPVACDFDHVRQPALEYLAMRAYMLGRRAIVSGRITYNQEGYPIRIMADAIEIMPDPTTLPNFDDVIGIFGKEE